MNRISIDVQNPSSVVARLVTRLTSSTDSDEEKGNLGGCFLRAMSDLALHPAQCD